MSKRRTAADVLTDAANTFRERNAKYKSNFLMVGAIMKVLFPNGAPAALLHSHQFHLFELIVVKLSRLAISDIKHQDSARDLSVYAAMIEDIITNPEYKQ